MFYKRFLELLCIHRAKLLASVQPDFLIITLVWWLLSLSSICFCIQISIFETEREREKSRGFLLEIHCLGKYRAAWYSITSGCVGYFQTISFVHHFIVLRFASVYFPYKVLIHKWKPSVCHTEHTTCNYYYYFFSRINHTAMALAFVMALNIVFNEWFMFGYVVYVRAQTAWPWVWVWWMRAEVIGNVCRNRWKTRKTEINYQSYQIQTE